jgi:hypothetical protein
MKIEGGKRGLKLKKAVSGGTLKTVETPAAHNSYGPGQDCENQKASAGLTLKTLETGLLELFG